MSLCVTVIFFNCSVIIHFKNVTLFAYSIPDGYLFLFLFFPAECYYEECCCEYTAVYSYYVVLFTILLCIYCLLYLPGYGIEETIRVCFFRNQKPVFQGDCTNLCPSSSIYLLSCTWSRVGHDWATSLSLFTFMHWRRKWQPAFFPGESQGQGSLLGCRLWGRTESDTTEVS